MVSSAAIRFRRSGCLTGRCTAPPPASSYLPLNSHRNQVESGELHKNMKVASCGPPRIIAKAWYPPLGSPDCSSSAAASKTSRFCCMRHSSDRDMDVDPGHGFAGHRSFTCVRIQKQPGQVRFPNSRICSVSQPVRPALGARGGDGELFCEWDLSVCVARRGFIAAD